MAAACGTVLLTMPGPAGAADKDSEAASRRQLKSVQQDINAGKTRQAELQKQSAQLLAEVTRLRNDSVAAARAAQQYERDLLDLQARLDELTKGEAEQKADLLLHQKRESALLAALQRIAIEPPAALAFSPGSPLDSLRSAMLISDIQPRLNAEAAALSVSITALTQTREEMGRQRDAILVQRSALEAQRKQLTESILRRQKLEGTLSEQSQEQRRRLTALASRATSLQEVIDEAEKARAEAEAAEKARLAAQAAEQARQAAQAEQAAKAQAQTRNQQRSAEAPAAAANGSAATGDVDLVSAGTPQPAQGGHGRTFLPGRTMLVVPVSGRVTTRYGAKDGYVIAKGLTIATRPGATVVTPFDGTVLFAGPFKGYGDILIIDHGGGYASLLAHLAEHNIVVGQHLVAGEPVGTMSGEASGDAKGTAAFYMEFRHNNQPIDPLPLLGRG